jgi:oligoendopeptidase F
MGVDELHIYDLYPPMVKGFRRSYPYDDAQRILPEALAPLGDEYVRVLREGLDPKNGWIDVYPNKHKESGAFSVGVWGVHPYVKMNYFGELDDLSTLAHEYGHAVHSHLSMKTQPYVTFNYAAFNAEIASTINEKLLHDYLYARAQSDDERLYLLNELVETLRTTIYRQALFAEFELAAHTAVERGTPLTADWLSETYAGLLRRYYGPDFTLGANDGIEWAYIPHFFYNFYVYQYATSIVASTSLARGILAEASAAKPPTKARDAYLAMLSAGSSKYAIDLLKDAGVDMTTSAPFSAAMAEMNQVMDDMEALLKK